MRQAKPEPAWKTKRKEELRTKIIVFAIVIPMEIVGIGGLICGVKNVFADEPQEESTEIDWTATHLVSATAYYDSYGHGYGSTGQPLVEGLTVAGRQEDIGKTCLIYECNEDGSQGDLIEIGEFRDVGYGQPTGSGSSKLIKGKSIGTIEAGECIDLYFDSYESCVEWGRRNVYILIVDAVG